MLVPAWPQGSGSGAGVRTRQLARAVRDWGFNLTVASHARPDEHSKALEEDGLSVHHTRLTQGDTLRDCLKGAPPELVLFDRFYCEERAVATGGAHTRHAGGSQARAAACLYTRAGRLHTRVRAPWQREKQIIQGRSGVNQIAAMQNTSE
eukprot:1783346-Pleurochrysis_carterae.AAC.2